MKTLFMKSAFFGLALAGAALIGAGSPSAAGQSKSSILDDPQAVSYSWGVIVSADDGPQSSSSWREVEAAENVQASGLDQMHDPVYQDYLQSLFAPSEFDND